MMHKDGRKYRQKKHENDISWGKAMMTTIIMILLIVVTSFDVTNYINRGEEEKSFDRLYEEADDLAGRIEMYADSDREELELLASVIAKYDELDSTELWNLLDSYSAVGMMSRIELLIPGDKVLARGGKSVDAGGILSFEEESVLGTHITDRETDILDPDKYIVRHYVPVIKDGKTVAMLYGVIELGELPEEVNLNPYGGEGAMYIIDGNTGDFLVDTWHPGKSGNMWEMGQREMASGYDADRLKEGVLNGESRYVVFVSETTGEYLYFYYEPMDINEWRIAVSVPESVVFERASEIKRILNIFLLFELICFVAYFLWMVHYARQVTGEKQKRLENLNYMYDVEKLLFNAHEKRDNVFAALEKISSVISAEKAGFWIVDQGCDEDAFLWEKKSSGKERREIFGPKCIDGLLGYFKAGNAEFEAYDDKSLMKMFAEKGRAGIWNMMAVPVEDVEGKICGILAVFNIEGGQVPTALLKSMEFSFSMFCRNLKIYTEIKKRGDRDALTGLYNRNRYERDLADLWAEYTGAMMCVYIDVNGLHEMNNTEGHDKGDQMLRSVAKGLAECFETKYIYRTGGDEFVAFITDMDEKKGKMQGEKLSISLEREGYHISVGIEYEERVSSMSELIRTAEKKMYGEKKRYYEQKPNDRRRTVRQ